MDDWRRRAACRGMEVEEAIATFFPDQHQLIAGKWVRYTNTRTGYATAELICAECPVVQECLDDEARNAPYDSFHGFRGGMNPRQRGRRAGFYR